MYIGMYDKYTHLIINVFQIENIQQLNQTEDFGYIQIDKKFYHKYKHFKYLVDGNRIIKLKTTENLKTKKQKTCSILSFINNQLWKLTNNFYSGSDKNNVNNRLSKPDTDIYVLGILNYYRKKDGKQIIGDIVINPDNEYMLANLAWGQNLWNQYYQKMQSIKLQLQNSSNNIEIDLTKFKSKVIPYSLSQIIQWQKDHPTN